MTRNRELSERIALCMNVLLAHRALPFGVGHVSGRDPETGEIQILGHLHLLERDSAEISPDDIISIDDRGRVIDGAYEPPDEFPIHTEIFRARPDVGGIVHGHPQALLAATAAGLDVVPLDVRSTIFRPAVPVLGYPLSTHITTEERGRAVVNALGPGYAVALAGHGSVTVGASPEEAVVVSFFLERAAEMRLQIGAGVEPATFPESEIDGFVTRGISPSEFFMTAWRHYRQTASAADPIDIAGASLR
jgi:L-fuculose-phosphate aldolase